MPVTDLLLSLTCRVLVKSPSDECFCSQIGVLLMVSSPRQAALSNRHDCLGGQEQARLILTCMLEQPV